MTDYQPTDEQIEALAATIEASSGGWHFTPDHFEKLGPLADFQARAVAQSSALQAIIRAAQAEALREHAEHVRSNHTPHAMSGIQAIVAALEVQADRIEAADVL